MINGYIEQATGYVLSNYSTKVALASGALCAVAATEMAVRTLADMVGCITEKNEEVKARHAKNLSRDFFGAALFGMCASNAIPGIAALGALVFIGNACMNKNEESLVTTKLIAPITPIVKKTVDILINVISNVAKSVFDICFAILEVVNATLAPILSCLGTVLKVVVPKSHEAVATVVVAGAILFYKYGKNAL